MTKIKSSATNTEILEAMKHPQTGVGFLTQHPSLPSQTFVSADAIQWLNNHIEGGMGVEQGINIMKVCASFRETVDKPTGSAITIHSCCAGDDSR